jgi:hypothetical protein
MFDRKFDRRHIGVGDDDRLTSSVDQDLCALEFADNLHLTPLCIELPAEFGLGTLSLRYLPILGLFFKRRVEGHRVQNRLQVSAFLGQLIAIATVPDIVVNVVPEPQAFGGGLDDFAAFLDQQDKQIVVGQLHAVSSLQG